MTDLLFQFSLPSTFPALVAFTTTEHVSSQKSSATYTQVSVHLSTDLVKIIKSFVSRILNIVLDKGEKKDQKMKIPIQRRLFPIVSKRQENLHLKISSVYVVCWTFLQTFQTYFLHTGIQANSVDPDQTRSSLIWVHTVCRNDF